ncbi:Ig-like domain (group 3), partial [Rhodococcus tukisamuensis]
MRLSISHRIATPLTAAAAAAGLILLGLSPASADPGQTSNQGSSSNLIYKKSVVGGTAGATLKPGDTVTYKNEVIHNSGVERYVTRIRDIPPAGFVYESGSATGTGSGANIVQEADGSVLATCSSGCSFLGGGFVVKSGQNLTYTVTYKVPANAPVGIFNSGMFYDVWSFGSTQGFNPANVNVQVLPADVITNTTVSAPATANTGEQVNLTATVDPTAPGSVQFKDGTVNIGGPVTVANGTATLPHTFDTIGAHAITAVFTAGNGFVGSTSPAQTVNVVTATTTTLTVPATAVVGADVTIEATIAPATAPGQVQFKDGNVNIGDPVTVANGTASITRKFPEAKSHSITAHFVGTGGYNNSDSAAATLNVTDADFNTTTTVLEPVTATVGVPVNLAATVMPIPDAGQVEFTVDGVPVGTADVGTG